MPDFEMSRFPDGFKPGPRSSQCVNNDHRECQQGGCGCRCHFCVIYNFNESGRLMVKRIEQRKRKLSERGNWLVVTVRNQKIDWCTWVRTWAGVQASKRNAEKLLQAYKDTFKHQGRVIVLDINRMLDFAVTEGANEIADLEQLFNK